MNPTKILTEFLAAVGLFAFGYVFFICLAIIAGDV